MIKRLIKIILFITLVVNSMISQSEYKGKLIYTVTKSETESFHTYAEMSGIKEPYSRYLNVRVEYTISGDTIVFEQYDEYGELYHVNIQIGSNIWTGSNYSDIEYNFGELINVSNFDVDICLVNDWKKVKEEKDQNQRIESYVGQAIQNEITYYEIKAHNQGDTIVHNKYEGLFCKIFCEYGLIVESVRIYRENTTEMKLVQRIDENPVNCRQKLNMYYLKE